MIDKVKNILTIILVVFIIVAIVYGIVNLIISAFQKPELITYENIDEYISEAEVVTNYSTYFFVEDCLENLIEGCMQDKYEKLYDIYIDEYTKEYSKSEIISKLKAIVARAKSSDIDYTFEYNLNKVYSVNDQYLAEITIDGSKTYMIFEQTSKGYSYGFAFVK